MKKILLVALAFVFLLNIVFATQQDVFVLNLKYDKGNVSIQNLIKTKGFFNEPVSHPEKGYRLEVISFDNKLLYSQKFNFELEIKLAPLPEWFDEKGNQIYFPSANETKLKRDTATIELIFPYFENAQRIDIYSPDNLLVLSTKVDTDKKAEPKEYEKKSKYATKNIYIGIVSLLIIVILFLIIRKRKNYSE